MASKKVFVDYAGKLSEIANGDTILVSSLGTGTPNGTKFLRDDGVFVTPPGGGSLTVVEKEVDFGTIPRTSKKFIITDASSVPTSKIIVTPSGNIATGRGSDDWEWDSIIFTAKASTGIFTVYANSATRVTGKRKIFYTIN